MRKRKSHLSAHLAVVTLLAGCQPNLAPPMLPSADGQFNLLSLFCLSSGSPLTVSNTASYQFEPEVAYNPLANEYLVVWLDDPGNNADIHGQRLSTSGARLGLPFVISGAPGNQTLPAVAYNSKLNEYLVLWTSSSNIFAQRVGGTGNLVGGVFPLSTASGERANPRVAANDHSGEFLAVWSESRDSGPANIYGQRIGAKGQLIGTSAADNLPISTADGDQTKPDVAYNSKSLTYLVTWSDERDSIKNLFGQLINNRGQLQGTTADTNFPITSGSPGKNNVRLAANTRNREFLLVWEQVGTSATQDIFAQRVDTKGALLNGPFTISAAVGNQIQPKLAFNPVSQEYLVTWSHLPPNSFNAYDIYAQLVDQFGRLISGDIPLSADGIQSNSTVATNAKANQYLVVWEDLATIASDSNLLGRILGCE